MNDLGTLLSSELQLAWTTALRSGNYKQLQDGPDGAGGFCANSLLAYLAGVVDLAGLAIPGAPIESIEKYAYSSISQVVQTMNDDGISFTSIADYLDALAQ